MKIRGKKVNPQKILNKIAKIIDGLPNHSVTLGGEPTGVDLQISENAVDIKRFLKTLGLTHAKPDIGEYFTFNVMFPDNKGGYGLLGGATQDDGTKIEVYNTAVIYRSKAKEAKLKFAILGFKDKRNPYLIDIIKDLIA